MQPNETSLTSTQENYLATIFRLVKQHGEARSNAIADELNVSRSSVTTALKSLSARNLIAYKPYNPIQLTPDGHELGKRIAHRNLILSDFFGRVLQLPEEAAKAAAWRVEHAMSDDVVLELGRFILFLSESGCDIENWRQKYSYRGHRDR
ncbi:MAG: DtxR family iron (metal) dependent repressor [Deltaproteobacteria bacterium]|nr:MAG: DtxR family iron (metal) dependent repressor [Deltaproteobacteria bacterium]